MYHSILQLALLNQTVHTVLHKFLSPNLTFEVREYKIKPPFPFTPDISAFFIQNFMSWGIFLIVNFPGILLNLQNEERSENWQKDWNTSCAKLFENVPLRTVPLAALSLLQKSNLLNVIDLGLWNIFQMFELQWNQRLTEELQKCHQIWIFDMEKLH